MLITYQHDDGTTTVLASTITRMSHFNDAHGERTVVGTSQTTFVALETAAQYENNLKIWSESLRK